MHPHAARELSDPEFPLLIERLKLLSIGACGLGNLDSLYTPSIPKSSDCFVRWVFAAWTSEVRAKVNSAYKGDASDFSLYMMPSFLRSFESAAHEIMDAIDKIPKEYRREVPCVKHLV
jgi:hypothetical protein